MWELACNERLLGGVRGQSYDAALGSLGESSLRFMKKRFVLLLVRKPEKHSKWKLFPIT